MAYSLNRGMGALGCMAVSDLVAACGGGQTCGPMDEGCIANQAGIVQWAETVQDANWGPEGPCIPDGTTCGYTPPANALQLFMSNQPVYSAPASTPNGPVGGPTFVSHTVVPGPTGGVDVYTWSDGSQTTTPIYGQGQIKAPTATSSPVVTKTPILSTAPTTSTTPSGSAIVNSSGASGSTPVTPASTTTSTVASSSSWFTESTFAGIPNWGLVAAAGVGLLLFMGGGHGR